MRDGSRGSNSQTPPSGISHSVALRRSCAAKGKVAITKCFYLRLGSVLSHKDGIKDTRNAIPVPRIWKSRPFPRCAHAVMLSATNWEETNAVRHSSLRTPCDLGGESVTQFASFDVSR